MKNNVLIVAFSGSENMGDDAIFRSLSSALLSTGGSEVKYLRFGGRGGVDGLPAACRPVSALNPFSVLHAIWTVDRVVWGGGGLIQQESSRLNLIYFLSVITLALFLGRPVELRGMGVSRITGVVARGWTRWVLKRVTSIRVRDHFSKTILEEMGLKGVSVEADLAFSLSCHEHEGDSSPRQGILFFLRPPLEPSSGWLPASFRYRRKPSDNALFLANQLARIVDDLSVSFPDEPVTFIPCHAGRDENFSDLVKAALEYPDRVNVLRGFVPFEEAVSFCRSAKCVISMRFHGCIAAIRAGAPLAALAYAEKVASLRDECPEADISTHSLDAAGAEELSTRIRSLLGRAG